MPNINVPHETYDANLIPDCRDKPLVECATINGCQVYNDECVPDIHNTIANQFHGNDEEVMRTLGIVTGKPPRFFEEQFRDMYSDGAQPSTTRNEKPGIGTWPRA